VVVVGFAVVVFADVVNDYAPVEVIAVVVVVIDVLVVLSVALVVVTMPACSVLPTYL